jgi:hypothetical protein
MFHHRQGLTLGLEASDDLFGIHPKLDDLQGDPSANGMFLLSHKDDAEASFADLLEEFVAADLCARAFTHGNSRTGGLINVRKVEKAGAGGVVRCQERFNALPQLRVISARLAQVRSAARSAGLRQGLAEDFLDWSWINLHMPNSFLPILRIE